MQSIIRQAQPIDAQKIAEIHVASWQTAFCGIMPDNFLEQQETETRKIGWLKNMVEYPGNLSVIEDNAKIVGFVCNGLTESKQLGFDGQVFGIHVDPTAKRRGYGYQLMLASFNRLQSLGCKNAFLWTLEKNIPARNFYEKLGGKIVAQELKDFGGRELIEIAYGWDRLDLIPKTQNTPRP